MTVDEILRPYSLTGTVTQEDIDEGILLECEKCPVARAVSRMLPAYPKISVSSKIVEVWFTKHTGVWSLDVADDLAEWILAYDREQPVRPIGLRIHAKLDGDWEVATRSFEEVA